MERDVVNAIVAHVLKDGNSFLVLPFEVSSLFLTTEICFYKLKSFWLVSSHTSIEQHTCTLIEQEKCVPFLVAYVLYFLLVPVWALLGRVKNTW